MSRKLVESRDEICVACPDCGKFCNVIYEGSKTRCKCQNCDALFQARYANGELLSSRLGRENCKRKMVMRT